MKLWWFGRIESFATAQFLAAGRLGNVICLLPPPTTYSGMLPRYTLAPHPTCSPKHLPTNTE